MMRNSLLLAVAASILVAGCGQVAPQAALQSPSQAAVEADGRRLDMRFIKAEIKRQLETSTPDHSFRFIDEGPEVSVAGKLITFQGTAQESGFAGGTYYLVEGTYDLSAQKARITKKERLGSAGDPVVAQPGKPGAPPHGANPVSDAQIRDDIKKSLEVPRGPSAYSVISGISLAGRIGSSTVVGFKAHERVVGHGWEERYGLAGSYDTMTYVVRVSERKKLSGNGPIFWPR